jgi:beta-lactamase family protein
MAKRGRKRGLSVGRRRRFLAVSSTAAAAISLTAAAIVVAGAPGSHGKGDHPPGFGHRVWPRVVYPSPGAVREAQEFAASFGDVSFAVIDAEGGLRGYEGDRLYSSASASKVLLLAAELRRLRRDHEPLDSETKALLEPMITYSDNGAAGSVYARVGDTGMEEVAERAGMRSFDVDPGFWGGAQVTADDMARFYWRLERNLAGPYRDYGLGLLAHISSPQRWGIPAALDDRWRIWFKGGWRPPGQEGTTGAVTHQGALLEHRDGERLALAVLSDEAPGTGAGYTAIEGIAERLLAKPPPNRSGWLAP